MLFKLLTSVDIWVVRVVVKHLKAEKGGEAGLSTSCQWLAIDYIVTMDYMSGSNEGVLRARVAGEIVNVGMKVRAMSTRNNVKWWQEEEKAVLAVQGV